MKKDFLLNLLQSWGVRVAAVAGLSVAVALFIQVAWNLALTPLGVATCTFQQAVGWTMLLGLFVVLAFLLRETESS